MLFRLLLLLCISSTVSYSQFVFPSKEGRLSLHSKVGLIPKNQTTKFEVKSLDGKDLNDVTIIAVSGSISYNGAELNVNVANESFIYLLAMYTDEGGTELIYYDLIGLPIAPSTYPYIVVYADNVPVNPARGVSGITEKMSMKLLYDELQGSCKNVFVNQVAFSFTDRQREVGMVRKQGDEALVHALFLRGASPHLQIKAKAESIGCTDKLGILKIISPKINRTFTYGVTSSNLDKDVSQIISHMNAENKKQASSDSENKD